MDDGSHTGMGAWSRFALRARLVALLAVAFSVLGVFLGWHLLADRDRAIAEAERDLLTALRAITAQQDALVTRTDPVLDSLSDSLAAGVATSTDACNAPFAAVLQREPAYTLAGMASAEGRVVCEARSRLGADVADRAWFRAPLQARGLVVSDVVVSRVTGQPTVMLSKARRDAQGRLQAVFFVGVGLDWVQRELAQARFGDGARLSVMDGQGILVARVPDPERWVGTPLAQNIASKVREASGPGTFVDVNRVGQRRIIAHMPMLVSPEGTHYRALLSVPESVVTRQALRDMVWSFVALALVLLATGAALVAGVHRWVLKPVSMMAATVRRVQTGDLAARSGVAHGVGEIGLLAAALDGSTAAVQDRESRLQNANRALRVLSAGNRTLLQAKTEATLLAQMTRAIVDAGGFLLTWVGYPQQQRPTHIQLMASAAARPELAEKLVQWQGHLGEGPVARTLETGEPSVWVEGQPEPDGDRWAEGARDRGCRSALVLPLCVEDRLVGVLTICSEERDIFDAAVVDVLVESSHDLALGIRVARAEVERRQVDEQLRRHRDELEVLVGERTAELASAMARADAANRAKSAFLANMSHEIRTPMNAIIGLTHLMARDTRDALQRERLGKVTTAAKHLLQVINDVLDLSKIEAGKLVLTEEPFSRDELLSSAFELVTLAAEAKGIELIVDTDHLPARMQGDAKRIAQALINLLANAVKFTEQGWVRLRGELLGEDGERQQLRFEIRDSGVGIPRERQAALFQAFEQADVSTTRQYGGTGLGLALTKQIAALMGGRVGMTSEVGQGSTFWFTAWVKRAQDPHATLHDDALVGLRALVVDDLPEALQALDDTLQQIGVTVVTARSGREALQRAEQEVETGRPFDLLVVDWRMPDMDGMQTLAAMRAQHGEGMPLSLLVTAYNEEQIWHGAREMGIDAVLVKPVTPTRLRETLRRVLRRQPDTSTPQAPGEAEGNLRMHHAGRRVLLAEDNPINQEVALELLGSVGLIVETAPDGPRAVELATSRPYDLVLMDIQMPRMDGLAAAQAIRTRLGPDLPIIAMTANAFGEDRSACLEAGMNDHLGKPVDPARLFEALLRWLPRAADPAPPRTVTRSTGEASDALQDRLARVPGFDMGRALRNTGGKLALVEKMVRRFADNYAQGVPGLLDSRSGAPVERWAQLAHSLRGACLVVGAASLGEAVAEFEHALKSAPAVDDGLAEQASGLHASVQALALNLGSALRPEREDR